MFNIVREIKDLLFYISFRADNRHNSVRPVGRFPKQCVRVGHHTYGPLQVVWIAPLSVRLSIGNYCSIGPAVKFLVGGGHNYRRISTYPFQSMIYGEKTVSKDLEHLDITVEDDVWIGYDALIMSGVTIGKGSVIGARSVVTKDVPPYSVFIGNKVARRRFPDEVIEKLVTIDYDKLRHAPGDAYQRWCQTEITPENVDEVLKDF